MLYKDYNISKYEALNNADSRTNLGLHIRLDESGTGNDISGLYVNTSD